MNEQLRNPFHVDTLPVLAQLHRWAFRSGSTETPAALRLLSRAAFYAGQSCSPWPHQGRFDVAFSDGWRSANFDARNRMFCALYFDAFAAGFEPPVAAMIERFVPPRGVFYDIGANWGYHSVFLASRPDFTGRIHAFEPWPSTFRSLDSVVRQLQLHPTITCHNFAVGQCSETGVMSCGTNCGCARLVSDGRGAKVQVHPLDDLQLPPPDVIKIDTEGHEEQVLLGAVGLLQKYLPLVIFEHRFEHVLAAESRFATLELLESLGYRLFLPQYDADHGPGLRVSPVTIDQRCCYPECADLLACHQERLHLLEDVLCPSLPQAA